jgi:translation initiation factor IF-1
MSARTCERGEHVNEPTERTAEGVVLELLPSQLVRVELEGRHIVTAHLASPVGRNYVRVIVGDRVRVQLMANDPGRARIVAKL